MDNRPIGFFDSGLGGLTSIPYLRRQLPEERVIYFGDTARTPYGSKAVSTIRRFSAQIADFLVKKDVKMIVIACNTVSATCLDELRERFPEIPILGIISPAAEEAARLCKGKGKLGIIGTKVTIASQAYSRMIRSAGSGIEIHETACPAFVPLIEEGIIDHAIMDSTIRYYMDDFIADNMIDDLILGCTHYPLIKKNLARIYPDVNIINPSSIIISRVADILKERDMLADDSDLTDVFYASDLSENFVNMIDHIFEDAGDNDDRKVKFVDLDIEGEHPDGL